MRAAALVAVVLAVGLSGPAAAQDPTVPVQEGAKEQSCRTLAAGTVGATDQVVGMTGSAPNQVPDSGMGVPATWAEAPAALKLPLAFPLRTQTETFNRRYAFVTRGGAIYVRSRADSTGPWRELPVPPCFAGRVASISLDDDEMIALDDARRVYTMDNALKDASLFNWSSRWGTPLWGGPGYVLPRGVIAWSWSVISPAEDVRWTDPAGNHPTVGASKVSHIWGLRSGGQRLTFWDPWLPLDESYEMCGPRQGRFRAVNMSASGSFIFVIGRRGDMFTRIYDFDLSGHDSLFFKYSYEDQRGKGDSSPIQLPAAPWVQQPKIPSTITSAISIHKLGVDAVHRILRVEGRRRGTTGYWQRDVASAPTVPWRFHATSLPLTRKPLANPRRDTSRVGLGRSETHRYRSGADWIDFNVYCSPARVHVGGRTLLLHHVDGLRQQVRGRGLDDTPRQQDGALQESVPPTPKFTTVDVQATRHEIRVDALGWDFKR